jgi:dTDP-4-dehydrorhamnose reductase
MKLLALVVGAGGQLGEAMLEQLSARHVVVPATRRELDVTNAEAVLAMVTEVEPDVIVNCSAYTNVDGAEDDPVTALEVNAMAVRALARAATHVDATFVHYSTDFVFDGRTECPYTEDDEPNPRGTYAMSKLLGEWFAADVTRHYVLRVESLFGGTRARSSIDRILENLRTGKPVRVVMATSELLRLQAPSGLYHCVNSGWTTWAGLARELATLIGRPDAAIEDIRMSDAGLKAPRPLFAALSNRKIIDVGVTMPTWQDALYRYVNERESLES